MDPLSDVLSVLQVEDAVFGRIEAGGHWALQGSKAKHVIFFALLDGPCWLIPDNTDEPIRMEAGDASPLQTAHPSVFAATSRRRRRTTFCLPRQMA
jgi:cupin